MTRWIALPVALLVSATIGTEAAAGPVSFVCRPDNDLYRAVTAGGTVCARYDKLADALAAVPDGSGLLVLADRYPQARTVVTLDDFRRAEASKLRLLVEYPATLPGLEVGRPLARPVERLVVASDFFGKTLGRRCIVCVNGLHYLPVRAAGAHLVAARVAGFDTAVYGLPEKTAPILFELSGGRVLVATTALSRFVTGRYAPQESWRVIWRRILKWLNPDEPPPLKWTPTVRPAYRPDENLPPDCEMHAIRRGLEWYIKARMLIHPSFRDQVAGRNFVESLPADAPAGDGSLGSMEGLLSVIHEDGSQRISTVQRGDCICETAMALALGGKVTGNARYRSIADRLLDYYLLESAARRNERGDPNHGAYGLIAWGITNRAWYKANYGDDNARQMMGTWAVAAVNGRKRWDRAMMMCLLANLRTTGVLGFRGNRIDVEALADGWQPYFHRRIVNLAPHFEAYLWACYLWAYEQTGDRLFLDRAETALKMTMAQYPDGWRWTNGLAQEKARIVLPLAWLVRVKDTPANRAMLRKAVDGLLALQDACGAIREQLGRPGRGLYPPPASNAAYGTNEASLIARDGDPVADLLYTNNFALLGLHEAAAATGEADILAAENKLARFLCRIQVRSDRCPQADGGWFRAFDLRRWEHWGANADRGWGAWAIESGWTQGWILAVLALRQMNTSLWELTHGSTVERYHGALRKQMIPDQALSRPADRR